MIDCESLSTKIHRLTVTSESSSLSAHCALLRGIHNSDCSPVSITSNFNDLSVSNRKKGSSSNVPSVSNTFIKNSPSNDSSFFIVIRATLLSPNLTNLLHSFSNETISRSLVSRLFPIIFIYKGICLSYKRSLCFFVSIEGNPSDLRCHPLVGRRWRSREMIHPSDGTLFTLS